MRHLCVAAITLATHGSGDALSRYLGTTYIQGRRFRRGKWTRDKSENSEPDLGMGEIDRVIQRRRSDGVGVVHEVCSSR